MKPLVPKISALVVSAIRNLREGRGSTAKDIMNYIVKEHHSGDAVIQRQTNAALKRGVDYGILRRVNGHYKLNCDPFTINPQSLVPQDRAKRKKRQSVRRRGRRTRRGRATRVRRRTKKVSIKTQQRAIINRRRGARARRAKRRGQDDVDDYSKDSVSRERNRLIHPSTKEDPKRGSAFKDKEHSRSRSRSRISQSQPRQPSTDPSGEPPRQRSREPSRDPSRDLSRRASRQGSPALSQSSGSSDHDDPDN